MGSFGDRRDNIGSFGRGRPSEDAEVTGERLLSGRPTIVVDVTVSRESLDRMTEDVAEAVRQGVERGFATAGTPQLDEEDEDEPG